MHSKLYLLSLLSDVFELSKKEYKIVSDHFDEIVLILKQSLTSENGERFLVNPETFSMIHCYINTELYSRLANGVITRNDFNTMDKIFKKCNYFIIFIIPEHCLTSYINNLKR